MMRIGHGYDVHRLFIGRRLILGGVEIPYEKGLLGHSDADVLTHAELQAQLCLCFRLFHLPLLQSFPAGRSTRGLPVLLVSLKQSNYSLDFIITQ